MNNPSVLWAVKAVPSRLVPGPGCLGQVGGSKCGSSIQEAAGLLLLHAILTQ